MNLTSNFYTGKCGVFVPGCVERDTVKETPSWTCWEEGGGCHNCHVYSTI